MGQCSTKPKALDNAVIEPKSVDAKVNHPARAAPTADIVEKEKPASPPISEVSLAATPAPAEPQHDKPEDSPAVAVGIGVAVGVPAPAAAAPTAAEALINFASLDGPVSRLEQLVGDAPSSTGQLYDADIRMTEAELAEFELLVERLEKASDARQLAIDSAALRAASSPPESSPTMPAGGASASATDAPPPLSARKSIMELVSDTFSGTLKRLSSLFGGEADADELAALERVVQRLEDLAGIPAATNEAAGGKHNAIPAGPPRALKEDELKKLDDAVERLEAAAIGESRV